MPIFGWDEADKLNLSEALSFVDSDDYMTKIIHVFFNQFNGLRTKNFMIDASISRINEFNIVISQIY